MHIILRDISCLLYRKRSYKSGYLDESQLFENEFTLKY